LSHSYEIGANFLSSLAEFDVVYARQVRESGCAWCGGVLDRADYPRKARGDLGDAGVDYERRLSLCCRSEGCRRRATPPSLRFLGRKVYVAALVIVASAVGRAAGAGHRGRVEGVPARTVRRWLDWWRLVLAQSTWWVEARGLFAAPVDLAELPCSLLERFDPTVAMANVLRLLAPITTTSVRTSIAMAV